MCIRDSPQIGAVGVVVHGEDLLGLAGVEQGAVEVGALALADGGDAF